jgi:Secretion system C-terminal sorting domain
MEILPAVRVTMSDNTSLTIIKLLKVAPTAHLTLLENAQLFQKNPESPNSLIEVVRKTGFLFKDDYTYFCSPVAGQQMNLITDPLVFNGLDFGYINVGGAFSPPPSNKYFSWNQTATPLGTDVYVYNTGKWVNETQTNLMDPSGKGFITKAPQSFPAGYDPAFPNYEPQKWQVKFTGLAHTGDQNTAVAGIAYAPFAGAITAPVAIPVDGTPYKPCANTLFTTNLIGNPYPAVLDADTFLSKPSNSAILAGYISFWTHKTSPSTSFPGNGTAPINYTVDDYVFYNLVGGIGNRRYLNDAIYAPNNVNRPTGKVATCQGFFAKAVSNGNVTFTESMTDTPSPDSDNQQFFRTANTTTTIFPTKNRFWLSLEGGGRYRETLIGYMPSVTTPFGTLAGSVNTYDKMYDAEFNTTAYNVSSQLNNRLEIYSIMSTSNPCPRLMIQGRKLDAIFNTSDVIPLGFSCPAGEYTIKAELLEGLFNTQLFWLREQVGSGFVYYDIRTVGRTFTSSGAADNTSRFQIVFKIPSLASITFPTAVCGSQITDINNSLFSTQITGATGYLFEVRTGGEFGPVFGVFSNTTPYPYIFNLNLPGVTFNTPYWIRVATFQVNGVWVYGPSCMIITPALPPKSNLIASACNVTISGYWNTLFAQQIVVVGISTTQYRFNATLGATTFVFTAPPSTLANAFNSCNLHSFVGVGMPLTPNTAYSITVDVLWNGVWQIGTIPCIVTSPNILPRMSQLPSTESKFDANAYPNPFATNFKLDITPSNDGTIAVKVYDMVGRLIEERQVLVTEIDTQEVGDKYPTGVYSIVISQGENIKTVRVIKR